MAEAKKKAVEAEVIRKQALSQQKEFDRLKNANDNLHNRMKESNAQKKAK